MPFGKYHIVIFKEKCGFRRSVHLRGGLGFIVLALFAVLIAGNVWLWDYYVKARDLEVRLHAAERSIEERQSQWTAMATDMRLVRDDLMRLQSFDTKLRLIMDMDADMPDTTSMGGASPSLSFGYVPMHRQELTARKMRNFLQELADAARLEEVTQQELLVAMRKNKDVLAATPSIWPTEGFVTSRFGSRNSPFTTRVERHTGLDISARMGTPIYATAKGTVLASGTDGAYGICVDVKHGGGITTKYAHMQKAVVKTGDEVQRGDLIGHVGRTGRVTGPHLHYEVRLNGAPTDPYKYILN